MMKQGWNNSRLSILACVLLIFTVFTFEALAGMYMWTDKDGRVHFSDAPPAHGGEANIKELPVYESDINRPEVPVKPSPTPEANRATSEEVVQESPPPVRGAKVELYTTSWCPWCRKAKEYFASKGIAFVEYDIEKDEAAARRKKQLDRQNGVPFAVINGKGINGYSEEAYASALGL